MDNNDNDKTINVENEVNDNISSINLDEIEKRIENETIVEEDETTIEEETTIENNNINDQVDKEENFFEEKKSKKKIIIIIIIVFLLLLISFLLVYFLYFKNKTDNEPNDEVVIVKRPLVDFDYTNSDYFKFSCEYDSKNNKIDKITKGMIVECNLSFTTPTEVSEIYLDLSLSDNLSFKEYKNDNNLNVYTNDNITFKLVPDTPIKTAKNILKVYLSINDNSSKTAYLETKNILYKDKDDKYFVSLNHLTSFPQEKTDKIYIYEEKIEDHSYYSVYKFKKNDIDPIDTYKCKNENCQVLEYLSKYILIYDDKLLIYNFKDNSSQTIKTTSDFNYTDYDYELIKDNTDNLLGIIIYQDYADNSNCDENENCTNEKLSGYYLGYYSIKEDNYTIASNYDYVGNWISNDNNTGGILLMKGNKYGYYSFKDDKLLIQMSDKYSFIDYNYNLDAIMLEHYDTQNKQYYYTFFDCNSKSYKVNVKKLEKYKKTNLYYTYAVTSKNQTIVQFFDSNGETIKDLIYANENDITTANDKKIVIDKNSLHYVYDSNGSKIYVTKFDDKDIYGYTKNYLLVKNNNMYELYDTNNNKVINITEITNANKFSSMKEENNILSIYIIDNSIEEENLNGYKYTYTNKKLSSELVKID